MNEPKFQEGQVVKIKSYEELKADEYHLLYSDERLKEVAEAEVAIYKVINDLRAVTWYEVGQCGHNVIQIPETYIKGEVELPEVPASEEANKRNFFEFSNMVRAAVFNGEYPYRDLRKLLKECLSGLEEKEIKELAVSTDSLYVRRLLVAPGITFFVNSCNEFIKGFTGFMPPSGENTDKEESPYTFQDILKMIQRELNLFSARRYIGKLRNEGLKSCLKEIKDAFSRVEHSLTHYGEKGEYFENHNIVILASFVIQTVICLDVKKELYQNPIESTFYGITKRMISDYNPKNDFSSSLDRGGLDVARDYIGEQIDYYCKLVEEKADKYTLVNTLMSIANCCVLTILWIDRNPRNNQPQ